MGVGPVKFLLPLKFPWLNVWQLWNIGQLDGSVVAVWLN